MRTRISASVILVGLMLAGCASPQLTPEEKAAIAARRAEAAARIEQEKKEFEASVAARMQADSNAPPRLPDPGYPAARCISPRLPDTATAVSFPSVGAFAYGGAVCDNTDAGLKVLAWREWYCRGFESETARLRDCVISWWRNGVRRRVDPPGAYGSSVAGAMQFARNPRGDSIVLSPTTWQPGMGPSSQHPDRAQLLAGDRRAPVRIALAYKVEVQRGSQLFGGIDTYYVLESDGLTPRVDRASTATPGLIVAVHQGFKPGDDIFPRLFQFATNRGARIYPGTPQGPNDNFTKWGFRAVPQNAELLAEQSAAISGYRIWRITPAQPLAPGEYGLRKEWRRDGYLFFPFAVD